MSELSPLISSFVDFLSEAKTTYHVVAYAARRLAESGFQEIEENRTWKSQLAPGGKYYFSRNSSSLFAFAVGPRYVPGNPFKLIVGHTDSPTLHLKPISKSSSQGCSMLDITTYGGGLWRTWFDRDLTLAGKVLIRGESGQIERKLMHIRRPLLALPSLAIHLCSPPRDTFTFNKESNFNPILMSECDPPETESEGEGPAPEITKRFHRELLKIVAEDLGCQVSALVDFDLQVVDAQPASVLGARGNLVNAQGLDNKFTCFCAIDALAKFAPEISEDDECIHMIALFDTEEVGSNSLAGAKSNILQALVRRVVGSVQAEDVVPDAFDLTFARSYCVSSDNAHAVHPNYASSHHSSFRPKMNGGPVVKINLSTCYSTSMESLLPFRLMMEAANLPFQLFQVRNDQRCGSTVGPHISTANGLRSIDIGAPQLAMHSIREIVGARDVEIFVNAFLRFFGEFEKFDTMMAL